jgi:hypothetical protein
MVLNQGEQTGRLTEDGIAESREDFRAGWEEDSMLREVLPVRSCDGAVGSGWVAQQSSTMEEAKARHGEDTCLTPHITTAGPA